MPIVMQWDESVEDGRRYWYLASLREDASYFGYVHIRTNSLNENRSFAGQLQIEKYRVIRLLIEAIEDSGARPNACEFCEELIGFGTRSNFTEVFRYSSDMPTSANVKAFHEVIAVLQSSVCSAAMVE